MSPDAARDAIVGFALVLGVMWYVGRANRDRREHSPTITINVQPSIGCGNMRKIEVERCPA